MLLNFSAHILILYFLQLLVYLSLFWLWLDSMNWYDGNIRITLPSATTFGYTIVSICSFITCSSVPIVSITNVTLLLLDFDCFMSSSFQMMFKSTLFLLFGYASLLHLFVYFPFS